MRRQMTVNELSQKTGYMMGPQHPRAQAMMREQSSDEGEKQEAEPPGYRDAEPDSTESCGSCRDFMPDEGGQSGKCMRYGAQVMAGKVCDNYTPEISPGNEDGDESTR